MTKHTPGPWVIVGNRVQTPGTDRERRTVATVNCGAFEPDSPDALLIAAAPEMLAACYVLIGAAHWLELNPDSPVSAIEHFRFAADEAAAAIAKATGE